MKKLLLILLLIPNLVMAENVMYCQDELATGIVKENGVWITNNFNLERYTIKFNDDYTKLEGLAFPYKCSQIFGASNDQARLISCRSIVGTSDTFIFNKLSKRYQYYSMSPFSFVENGPDTSNFSAGTCEAF